MRVAALLVGVVGLAWLSSRQPPPVGHLRLLALGLALLTVWALWQVVAGFDRALAAVNDLPLTFQANAVERLESHRAFASLPLPGHLAILLATAVPLLASGLRGRRTAPLWGSVLGLALVGLALTRSPIGAALALAGCLALLPLRRHRAAVLAVVASVVLAVLASAIALRTDVARLEPPRLRLDNWRTALWVFRTAPVAGVGLGGFGQAAQDVPFAVGNRPAHAHCLPLELLAELGPAGLAGFLLGTVWFARLLVRLWPRYPELAVALTMVPLHNLVDFSFYVSAVALPWAVLLGWGAALEREPTAPGREAPGRFLAVLAAAAALLVAALHGTSVMTERAAVAEGQPGTRHELAWRAWRLAPWRPAPVLLVATAALEEGDPRRCQEAAELLGRAERWRPASAAVASFEARLAVARGAALEAASKAWLAHRRRPFDPDHERFLKELLAGLGEGRDGAQ